MTVSRRRKWKLLINWDFACVICGDEFAGMSCVSREHLVPRAMGGKASNNLAPSHTRCNSYRGSRSLMEAAKMIDAKRLAMTPEGFFAWVNTPVCFDHRHG
jgi:hypothetical protein